MIAGLPDTNSGLGDFDPFFTSGSSGFIAAIGLVFVSYGGLTKVASIAEEVEDPSKNIPLGVIVSLFVSTVVYTVGVLVAVAVVPADDLIVDQASPSYCCRVLHASRRRRICIAAALAVFASAANAGILAAARYPMAMSRDGLMSYKISCSLS